MQPQQHTGSYYAATVNDVTDYPPLAGDRTADVCVVGAGFTGISTALHLAERGYRVTVVEAHRVGWGASGRNGGQLIGGISGEDRIGRELGPDVRRILRQLRWEGHDIVRERVATYGIQCDLKNGYLDAAVKERQLRDLEKEYATLRDEGFPHELRLLSAAQTREALGTDAFVGSLLNMGNGHLHPLNLCVGEARAAVSLGAIIHERSPVREIVRGRRPKVVTDAGSVTADSVVLAGNAYHALERELRGILFPVRSYIVATQPLPADVVAEINPRDVAVCNANYVLQYFRLSADKRLLFGSRLNYYGEDPAVIKRKVRRKLSAVYPQLADVDIDFAWGGSLGVPVNRVPQLGRLAPGIFYCQGYSGHGVNVTHLAGRIMADAVAGTLEHFDLFAKIRPVRVPGGWLLKRPLVALGVLYYQMKDRL